MVIILDALAHSIPRDQHLVATPWSSTAIETFRLIRNPNPLWQETVVVHSKANERRAPNESSVDCPFLARMILLSDCVFSLEFLSVPLSILAPSWWRERPSPGDPESDALTKSIGPSPPNPHPIVLAPFQQPELRIWIERGRVMSKARFHPSQIKLLLPRKKPLTNAQVDTCSWPLVD